MYGTYVPHDEIRCPPQRSLLDSHQDTNGQGEVAGESQGENPVHVEADGHVDDATDDLEPGTLSLSVLRRSTFLVEPFVEWGECRLCLLSVCDVVGCTVRKRAKNSGKKVRGKVHRFFL